MKILICTGILTPESGGPATYTPRIAGLFREAGHDVKVITYSDKSSYQLDKDFNFSLERVVRSRCKIFNYIKYFLAVSRNIRNYDFVYSLDWLSAGLPIMVASKIFRKKYILRVGGGYVWEKYLQQGNSPVSLKEFYNKKLYKKYPILFRLIKRIFKNADKIIFNTSVQPEFFIKPYGLDKEKVYTVFNPIPEIKIESKNLDTSHGRGENITNEIIFAGRLIVMKNIENLLRGFAKVNLENNKLVIIGDGPQKEKLIKLSNDLGLENQVEFIPAMTQEDLLKRIINCRYFVIPSWTDISPNQFYENISLKIPTLITKENYSSVYDQTPLMIDPNSSEDMAEKMEYLSDEENYKKFTEDFKKINFQNSWGDVLNKHLEILSLK